MPMGGLGLRFQKEGFVTPKPMILIEGLPMFAKALKSFDPYDAPKAVWIVVREDDQLNVGLQSKIKGFYPECSIVKITEQTRGAVETAMKAVPFLDPDSPLVIMDCDFFFESEEFFQLVSQEESQVLGGILISFRSTNSRYSYAKIGADSNVVATSEKNPISDRALMGAYYFSKAKYFEAAAKELLATPLSPGMPEYYVSLVYNILIERGYLIKVCEGVFTSFGTPEELSSFLENQR